MIRLLITIAVIVLGITALLCALMFWVRRMAVRDEFEDDPCSTCLRWPERNGVDADCPRRK